MEKERQRRKEEERNNEEAEKAKGYAEKVREFEDSREIDN